MVTGWDFTTDTVLTRTCGAYKNYGTVKTRIHRGKPLIGDGNVEIAILRYCVAKQFNWGKLNDGP